MRVGYDRSRRVFTLTLTLFVAKSLPPYWLKTLAIELVHDEKPCSIRFIPEWTQFEAPHVRARLSSRNDATEVFGVRKDRDAALFHIKSVKLIRGGSSREFPNASSTAAFLARPIPMRDAEDAADT